MKRLIIITVLLAALALGYWLWRSGQTPPVAAEVVALQAADENTAGFARANSVRPFQFPQDHGPHPEYQTEWWYFTGNLQDEQGRRFGYQLTFFRRAVTPTLPPRESDWATNQIYFAHFAITDAQSNTHEASEIFSRGAAALAGASVTYPSDTPFRVWIENWSVDALAPDGSNLRLRADNGKMTLDLTVSSEKLPVLQGDRGLSQKTDALGNASYYYSLTRLATNGALGVNGSHFTVQGLSWMDHEFGTTGLGPNAAGWDWFSIQLDDGRGDTPSSPGTSSVGGDRGSEVMFFQIRNKDGSIEPLSSGTLIEPDGTTRPLKLGDVKLTVLDKWKSDKSGGTYPADWRLEIPSAGMDLSLHPLIPDQELRVSFVYWEGAVNITGTFNGKPVNGAGYVEMTGYAAARGDVGY